MAARDKTRTAEASNRLIVLQLHFTAHARSTRFGYRSFRVRGPTIWNKLLQDLRSRDTSEQ